MLSSQIIETDINRSIQGSNDESEANIDASKDTIKQ